MERKRQQARPGALQMVDRPNPKPLATVRQATALTSTLLSVEYLNANAQVPPFAPTAQPAILFSQPQYLPSASSYFPVQPLSMPWLPAFPPPLLLMSHDSDDTHPASEFEERSFRRKSILWRYILPWKHRKLFAENDLALLGEAAHSSQLPFLKVAAGAALQIERQKPSGEAAVVAAEAVETVVILWKSYQQAPDRDIWKQATAKFVEGLAVMLDGIRGRMTYEAERGLLYSVLHGNICRAKMEAYRAELQSILVKIASCHLDLQEISSSPSDSDISHSNDQIKSFDGNVMPDQEDCIVFCEDESNPNIKGVEAEDATVSQSVRQARKRRGKARQTYDIPEAVMSCPEISGAGAPSSSAATYPPYPGPDLPFSASTSYIPGNFSPYGGYFQSSGMPTQLTSSLNGIYALPLSPPAPTENQNMGTLPSTCYRSPAVEGSS